MLRKQLPKGLTKDAEQGQLFPRKEVRERRGGVTVAWPHSPSWDLPGRWGRYQGGWCRYTAGIGRTGSGAHGNPGTVLHTQGGGAGREVSTRMKGGSQ